MKELISFQNNLLKQTNNNWQRYLFPELKKDHRLLGIKGLRGVGKTTMLLQYLEYEFGDMDKGLYVTADHPYFYRNTLLDLAGEWTRYGGKLLLIDEVHKYPKWSNEIKLIYDGYHELRINLTSSSALDLFRGESDLSRRLVTRTLHGLSFREHLEFRHGISFQKLSLNDILIKHQQIEKDYAKGQRMLPLFEEYLVEGYFPFAKDIDKETFIPRLIQIINTVLESDLAFSENYSVSNIRKIKRLLGVITEVVPFKPNISKLAEKLQLGRNTVNEYLQNLHDALILHLMRKPGQGTSQLQKPDKIYIENTALMYALQSSPKKGTLRETYFMNQIKNAGYKIEIHPGRCDFLVEGKYSFEIGGKNKDRSQLNDEENGYLALDQIEYGFSNTIPLWLFGFLY